MYQFLSEIENKKNSSIIPDVEFSPDGSKFAVTFQDINEVHVYETQSQKLIIKYENPESQLDWPHGLVFLQNHIIVSNKHYTVDGFRPCTFTIYSLDDLSGKPGYVYPTPVSYLGEGHSMAYLNNRLYVTYSGLLSKCAIAVYNFSDKEGKMSGPVNLVETWFEQYGIPKGLCVNDAGSRLYVTMTKFNHDKIELDVAQYNSVSQRNSGKTKNIVRHRLNQVINLFYRNKNKGQDHCSGGIAVFDVKEDGEISNVPIEIIYGSQFSRPENISMRGDLCTVVNTAYDEVNLYNVNGTQIDEQPLQILNDGLFFPHDACLSPDRKYLIATNCGIKVKKGRPQWNDYLKPRKDNIRIYSMQTESTI